MIMWNWFFLIVLNTITLQLLFLGESEGLIGNKEKINYLTRRKESTRVS